MHTSENKKTRDYSREYQQRLKINMRLHADIDRVKAEALKHELARRQIKYAEWLEIQIDRAFRDWNLNFITDELPPRKGR